MFRDRKPDPEQSSKFVWNSADAEGTQEAEKPELEAPRERSTRHGRALVAAAVIVPLAGGAAGLVAHDHHHPATATAAEAAQVSPGPETAFAVPSASLVPSPSLSPSPSLTKTPSHSPSKVPTRVVTVVKTVAAKAPATKAAAVSAPQPIGYWTLNHTAADATGTHNGTANDVDWDGGAAVFAGAGNSSIVTSGPVLNTGSGHSFTVSASVFLTSIPAAPNYADTAVSQDAGTDSGFYLQYFEPGNCWAFSRVNSDTDNPTADRATSTTTPQVDVWTHLVGVYNAANETAYLYVNGKLEGTAKDATPFASSGPLAIARAFYNGSDTDWFHGLITQVKAFDQALSAAEVKALD